MSQNQESEAQSTEPLRVPKLLVLNCDHCFLNGAISVSLDKSVIIPTCYKSMHILIHIYSMWGLFSKLVIMHGLCS